MSEAEAQRDREAAQHGPDAPWTVVLSDVHLTDAQVPDPKRPLWKRFKHPDLFVDESFRGLLHALDERAARPIELVLAGDIFDFDSVEAMPRDGSVGEITWLERRRGLDASEAKSAFKIEVILDTHPVWVDALRDFLARRPDHRVVFIIGNHDLELHWPKVQAAIRARLGPAGADPERVRFCEWFYVSHGDTLIEHGNQYDAYCVCSDPVRPFIKKRAAPHVRTPFGNLACRLMLNGMGLFNPNVDSSFIMSLREYVRFFVRYVLRIQPHLGWIWLWSAFATFIVSVREGLLPAIKDPFILEERLSGIARRAQSSTSLALALRELHVHPAIFSPWLLVRELWLDRAMLLLAAVYLSIQVFALVNVFVSIPWWGVAFPLLVLLPLVLFYARSVHSDVHKAEQLALERAPSLARIAGVGRVIFGHTHRELVGTLDGVEVLNTGCWSPAYHDVECTRPFGRKCFALVRPSDEGGGRRGELMEWQDPSFRPIEREPLRLPEARSVSLAPPPTRDELPRLGEIQAD